MITMYFGFIDSGKRLGRYEQSNDEQSSDEIE
jgi:hypothetical protein